MKPAKIHEMPTTEILADLERIERALLQRPCSAPKRTPGAPMTPCVEAERQRPLSAAEKKSHRGAVLRSFDMYHPGNMCHECAAYWHVARAVAELVLRPEARSA